MYKYLGTMFTPKLVWTRCQKTLALQAQKGLFLIRKYCYACDGLPVDLQFELFDKMILPVLLYSSEVWGFMVANDIEKIHTRFCRYVLSVPSHKPTIAVLSETGRVPLYVHYFKRCIKYWLKVIAMPAQRYPKACYEMLYNLDQQGRMTWASSVRLLLYKYNFHEVWDQQGVADRNAFFREFSCRIKQVYMDEWEYDIGQASKLSLLRSVASSCIEVESYLCNPKLLRKYRAGVTKLRCSAHTLRIEKGRHSNELIADRVCKLCELSGHYVLDDEYHFMLHCPALSQLRTVYLPDTIVNTPVYGDLLTLLKSEDGNVQLSIAAYIYHASKHRTCLLSEIV